MDAIEVTQGIQNKLTTMPLVAERTTWVRVHVDTDQPGNWSPVDGAMFLQRSGEDDLIFGPENGPISTGKSRTDVDSALNFLIPNDYLDAGSLSITVAVWSFNAATLESQEPNPANNEMQLTVEFHDADVPTIWLVALDDGGGPGPVVNELTPLLGFAQVVHQDLLDFHPTAAVNYQVYPAPVQPGPEALEPGPWDLGLDQDDDPDDAEAGTTAGARRHEPNIRMAWLTADVLETDNVLGWVDASIPTGGYSGWAGYGVAWNKPNAGTPAHELGHSRGLAHVACKDADDNGVPDELKGGAIDPTHPNGLPPVCSLAPISEEGYFGLTTEQTPLTVYSNDPTDLAAAFPFMSYMNPGWTDPYHWCRLLDAVGVDCNPAAVGVPPKVIQPAVDCDPEPAANGLGLDLCLIDQLPPPADPLIDTTPYSNPLLFGAVVLGGDESSSSMALFQTNSGPIANGSNDGSCTAAASTTQSFSNVTLKRGCSSTTTIFVPEEPESWIMASGSVDLSTGEALIQQVATRETITAKYSQRYSDGLLGVLPGTAPMSYALTVVDQNGDVVVQVPADLDGAGHGDGSDFVDAVGFFQAIPAPESCDGCAIELRGPDGLTKSLVPFSSNAPEVASIAVSQSSDATLIEWVGSDADGDDITFDVLWSADGERWLHAATATRDTSVEVPHSALYPGGDGLAVRVVANDGARTGDAVSEPFSAPGHAPLLLITGVPESSSIEQYDTLLLQGHLIDAEDDAEQSETVIWQSNIDGDLGAGPLLRTRDLSPGVHTILASASDSDGNEVMQTVEIDVIARSTPTRYLEVPSRAAVAFLTGQPFPEQPADAATGGPVAEGLPAVADNDGGSATPIVVGGAVVLAGAAAAGFGLRRRRIAGQSNG